MSPFYHLCVAFTEHWFLRFFKACGASSSGSTSLPSCALHSPSFSVSPFSFHVCCSYGPAALCSKSSMVMEAQRTFRSYCKIPPDNQPLPLLMSLLYHFLQPFYFLFCHVLHINHITLSYSTLNIHT